MRNPVVAVPSTSNAGIFLQLGGAAEAQLPADTRSLLVAGRQALIEDSFARKAQAAARAKTGAEDEDEEDEEEEEEAQNWSIGELWYRGVGVALGRSTRDIAELSSRDILERGLIVWPHLEYAYNWQFVLTASSGHFEPLPEDHILLSNRSGALLDPSLFGEDDADQIQPDEYGHLYYLKDRCDGRQASTTKSIPGQSMPPLLWMPAAGATEGVRFSIAFARNRKVQLATLQVGALPELADDSRDESSEEL